MSRIVVLQIQNHLIWLVCGGTTAEGESHMRQRPIHKWLLQLGHIMVMHIIIWCLANDASGEVNPPINHTAPRPPYMDVIKYVDCPVYKMTQQIVWCFLQNLRSVLLMAHSGLQDLILDMCLTSPDGWSICLPGCDLHHHIYIRNSLIVKSLLDSLGIAIVFAVNQRDMHMTSRAFWEVSYTSQMQHVSG